MLVSLKKKIDNMRNNIAHSNFKAIKVFKKVIPRVQEDAEIDQITIKEVSKIIKNMKNSNACGDMEVTSRIVKTLSKYMAVALTHLCNHIPPRDF